MVGGLNPCLEPRRVHRLEPVGRAGTERMVSRTPAPAARPDWPASLPRPTRLFDPPERIEVIALLPDHPPAFFIWRRVRRRVARADGPERVMGEGWVGEEKQVLRDYYRIETDQGARFWVFRDAPAEQGGRWWLHGIVE
jgi:protein ImuB